MEVAPEIEAIELLLRYLLAKHCDDAEVADLVRVIDGSRRPEAAASNVVELRNDALRPEVADLMIRHLQRSRAYRPPPGP